MRSLKNILLLVAGLHAAAATPALAQRSEAGAQPRPTMRLVTGGVLGGAAGLAVGGLAGAMVGSNTCLDEGNPDSCRGAEGMFIGGLAGETLSIPLGVHLANGRAGRLLPSMLASAAITAAGAAAVAATESDGVLVGAAVAVPVLQLATSVLIERATTRRR